MVTVHGQGRTADHLIQSSLCLPCRARIGIPLGRRVGGARFSVTEGARCCETLFRPTGEDGKVSYTFLLVNLHCRFRRRYQLIVLQSETIVECHYIPVEVESGA